MVIYLFKVNSLFKTIGILLTNRLCRQFGPNTFHRKYRVLEIGGHIYILVVLFGDPIYLQSVIIHSANGGKGEGCPVEEHSVALLCEYGVRKPVETAGKGNLQTRITSCAIFGRSTTPTYSKTLQAEHWLQCSL
jgi:hypothetical protein